MAATEIIMATPIHPMVSGWDIDDTRNLRSNAKAERLLGVSDSMGATSTTKPKKKLGGLNFSFADFREALPSLHRKTSRSKLQRKDYDSDTGASTPSPTFDPSASLTSLNTTDSTSTGHKRQIERPRNNAETLSQAETLRVRKLYRAPSAEDYNEFMKSRALELPSLTTRFETSDDIGRRKRSVTSMVSFGSDSTAKGHHRMSRIGPTHAAVVQPVKATRTNPHLGQAEQHVQHWLDNADLDRRASVATRTSTLPIPSFNDSRLSSSGGSIQTLTSEIKSENEHATDQWPLPATNLQPPKKLRRIHKSDLLVESVLSLSSDEDDYSDDGAETKSTRSHISRSERSVVGGRRKVGHERVLSSSSSVIQLDSRPWIRPLPHIPPRQFPKRTLADIAAAGGPERPLSNQSWETDAPIPNQEQVKTPDMEELDGFLASPTAETPTAESSTHPLWRSSSGSGDIDIRLSRQQPHALASLPEEISTESTLNAKEAATSDAFDVSSFPVPPRSRSGSVVPAIQIQAPERPPLPKLRIADISSQIANDNVMLSPTSIKRSDSRASQGSRRSIGSKRSSVRSSITARRPVRESIATVANRKRTVSDVPIYVTGLESATAADDKVADADTDVTSYIFSNMF